MNESRVQTLIDECEIIDVLSRYAAGVDRRDAELCGSCFTDQVEVEMPGQSFGWLAVHDWVEKVMTAVAPYQATQHIITNHEVEIRGDEATCTAYVQAQHWTVEAALLIGGTYSTRLQLGEDGWRICRLTLTQTFDDKR